MLKSAKQYKHKLIFILEEKTKKKYSAQPHNRNVISFNRTVSDPKLDSDMCGGCGEYRHRHKMNENRN